MFFSVVIPTYNRAPLLKRCLKSLEEQSFKDFEVLVCDDGSTDETKSVVDSFASVLNIKYIWNENWGGPARPRNIGIANSSGQWVCFLDSDDWWYKGKLQKVFEYTEEYDFIYHDLDVYNTELNQKTNAVGFAGEKDFFLNLMLEGNFISNSSVSIKKDVLDKVGCFSEDRRIIGSEDFDLWLSISSATDNMKYIDESLGGYEVGGGGHLDSFDIKLIRRLEVIYSKYLGLLNKKERGLATGRIAYRNGIIYKHCKMYREAVHEFKIAFSNLQNPKDKCMSLARFMLAYCAKIVDR